MKKPNNRTIYKYQISPQVTLQTFNEFKSHLLFNDSICPYKSLIAEAVVQGVVLKSFSSKISQNSRIVSCHILFFDKVADLRPATLLKNRLWHDYFPANFEKFLRTSFLKRTPPVVASAIATSVRVI